MHKKVIVSVFTVLILAGSALGQSVDEIIAKNIEARGGSEKLRAVQSIRYAGKMTVGPGMEAPVVMEQKRPNRMRMDFTLQGLTGTYACDGKSGWRVMPFGGKKDPEPLGEDELKQAEEQADIDGPLIDYKEKGHTVELMGKESVEGTDTYKLKVSLKNGDIRYFYLDSEAYLEIKAEGKRIVRGTEVESETIYGDYKEVDGLMIPYSIETGAKGRPEKQKITIEKVEINPALDDSRFTMPEVQKPEPQPEKQ